MRERAASVGARALKLEFRGFRSSPQHAMRYGAVLISATSVDR